MWTETQQKDFSIQGHPTPFSSGFTAGDPISKNVKVKSTHDIPLFGAERQSTRVPPSAWPRCSLVSHIFHDCVGILLGQSHVLSIISCCSHVLIFFLPLLVVYCRWLLGWYLIPLLAPAPTLLSLTSGCTTCGDIGLIFELPTHVHYYVSSQQFFFFFCQKLNPYWGVIGCSTAKVRIYDPSRPDSEPVFIKPLSSELSAKFWHPNFWRTKIKTSWQQLHPKQKKISIINKMLTCCSCWILQIYLQRFFIHKY